MSFEDTHCPCGGKKERETMICAECEKAFDDTYEMKVMRDATAETWHKRSAAIKLLSMSRRRKRNTPYRPLLGAAT